MDQTPKPRVRAFLILTLLVVLEATGSLWPLPNGTHRGSLAFAEETKGRDRATRSSLGLPDYMNVTGFVEGARLPIRQPEVEWKVTLESVNQQGQAVTRGLSNPVVADGILYYGDDDGNVTAIKIANQTELWNMEHGSRVAVKLSVSKEFVFFGSEAGITALHRDRGTVAWTHAIVHGAGESTPIPVGDFVFASGYNGKAYCLKSKTGEVVWEHDFVEDAPPDPDQEFVGARARFQNIAARPNGSACDGKLFIQSVFDQSRVIAIDCVSGKRQWTFQAKGWISPAPTIADNRVYVASQDKHLYCVDRATGKLIWKFQAPNWLASEVAVHEGKVYLPVHGARLYQLAADTGDVIRIMQPDEEADRKGAVYSFPLIANQTAYFACGSGLLFAFDIETGKMRWKLRPSEDSELFTDPVTDGKLIFVTSRSNLQSKKGECAILAIGADE